MKPLPFPLPEQLPPPVALALFELLLNLTDTLWHQYEPEIVELIMSERNQVPAAQQRFDFDDEIPF